MITKNTTDDKKMLTITMDSNMLNDYLEKPLTRTSALYLLEAYIFLHYDNKYKDVKEKLPTNFNVLLDNKDFYIENLETKLYKQIHSEIIVAKQEEIDKEYFSKNIKENTSRDEEYDPFWDEEEEDILSELEDELLTVEMDLRTLRMKSSAKGMAERIKQLINKENNLKEEIERIEEEVDRKMYGISSLPIPPKEVEKKQNEFVYFDNMRADIFNKLFLLDNKKNFFVIVEKNKVNFNFAKLLKVLEYPNQKKEDGNFLLGYMFLLLAERGDFSLIDKNKNVFLTTDNFKDILLHKEELKSYFKGWKNKDFSTLMESVRFFLTDFSFVNKSDLEYVYNSIIPQMKEDLTLNLTGESSAEKEVVFLLKNMICFNKDLCEDYLKRDVSKKGVKRELFQALLVHEYANCFDSEKNTEMLINSNFKEVTSIKEKIIELLKNNISEDEMWEYAENGLNLNKKDSEEILHGLSYILNAERHSEQEINYITQTTITKATIKYEFQSDVCEKMLLKSITKDSERELIQTYFIYLLNKKIDGPLTSKSGKPILAGESIKNIDSYIELIDKKIKNVVTEKSLDRSIKIMSDLFALSEKDVYDIQKLVVNPIKKRFGLYSSNFIKVSL